MKKLLAILFATLSLSVHATVAPEELKGKTINIVVPYGTGGNMDIQARLYAKKLESVTGLNVLVLNKPGANGTIGSQFVAQAEPNGVTVGLFDTGPSMTNAMKNIPNAPAREQLVPLTAMLSWSLNYYVRTEAPYNDLRGLAAYLKANPGKMNYAVISTGWTIYSEEFFEAAGIKGVQPIVYKSSQDMILSVVKGETEFTQTNLGTALPLLEAGKIKIIAAGGTERLSAYPNVATVSETYRGLTLTNYSGIFVPRNVPPHIATYLGWAFDQVTKDAELNKLFTRQGQVLMGGNQQRAQQVYNQYYRDFERQFAKYPHLAKD